MSNGVIITLIICGTILLLGICGIVMGIYAIKRFGGIAEKGIDKNKEKK